MTTQLNVINVEMPMRIKDWQQSFSSGSQLSVRVSFSCTLAPIPKGFQLKALMKTPSSYLPLDYLELTD
jgi:hypothetical protein